MNKFIAFGLLVLSSFFALSAQAESDVPPPPAAVYQTEPFASGTYFTSTRCGSQKFSCSSSMTKSDMVARANICAEEIFGLVNNMSTTGPARTPYQGCVIPRSYQNDLTSAMKKAWAVCCVVPDKKIAGQCTFECHEYFNNK